MRQAQLGDKVKVHYTGRLEDGSVFSTSAGSKPLRLTIGRGRYIRGLEEAILGLEAGKSKTVVVPPEKAFGPYQQGKYIEVDRKRLPPYVNPKVGQKFQLKSEDTTLTTRVEEVHEDKIWLNGNHPLAGKKLTFDVELIEIL